MLDGKLPARAEAFLTRVVDEVCQLSVISQIELLSWQVTALESRSVLEPFVASCRIIDLSVAVVQRTIQLRQSYKVKLPDAIIAATALVNSCTLISRNDGDFRKIQELAYLNPFTDL